ncbi:MAG: sensor histidine kinase [Methylococcales bacterium]|nr:sensor histidine kinase [Methylococcales bacterium]
MKHYQALFEKSPLAILIIRNSKIERANRASGTLWETSNIYNVQGKSIFELFHEESFEFVMPKCSKKEHFTTEGKIICTTNKTVDVLISNVTLQDNIGIVTYLTLQNISEQKRAVSENEKKFRFLSNHAEEIRENERTRIAQEIHDELGSTLTVLKMDLFWLAKQLQDTLPAKCASKMTTILEYVDKSIKTTRNLITDLRPSILDHLGLLAAIEWQVNKFKEQCDIICSLKLPKENPVLDSKCNTVVFRIVQESLNNIAKHAKATEVSISLISLKNSLLVKIIDNGIGMTKQQINATHHYGIQGMHERVNFCCGEIAIFSEEGKGTIIFFKIPKSITESCSHD